MAYFCNAANCPFVDCKFKFRNVPAVVNGEEVNFYNLESACSRISELKAHQINMNNHRYRARYEREVRTGKRIPFPKLNE